MAVICNSSSPTVQLHKCRPIFSPVTKHFMLNHYSQVTLKNRKSLVLQVRSFKNKVFEKKSDGIICKGFGELQQPLERKTTEMQKKSSPNHCDKMNMELGTRIATHSILKDINNGREKNVVFSPLCLHIALNLITAGAKGPTLDQLLRFLDSENITQLNARSSLFMDLATAKPDSSYEDPTSSSGPIISIVNGIWLDECVSLKHSFKQLAEDVYKAKSQSVAFNQAEKVANDINIWAKEATKGHIQDIVSSNSLRDSVLVLTSALYFKGSWLNPFDASDTRDEDFHLLNGKRVRVPFMKKWNTDYFYRSFEGFKLLKMEYETGQDGKKYAMYIFLPDKYDGLQELIQKFHSDPKLFTDTHKLRYVEINKLWVPKLKYEYGSDLVENIRELGLDLPFEGKPGLTDIVHIGHENVYVSNAIQKSYIEVYEEGTIATSVTAFSCMVTSSAAPTNRPPKINFVADHPFLFIIKEEITETVLFVGAALDPLS